MTIGSLDNTPRKPGKMTRNREVFASQLFNFKTSEDIDDDIKFFTGLTLNTPFGHHEIGTTFDCASVDFKELIVCLSNSISSGDDFDEIFYINIKNKEIK